MQSIPGPAASRTPIIVLAVALVLALVGVVGIASGAADNDDELASTKDTTTTTFEDSGDGGDTGAGTSDTSAGATTTAAAGVTTTTAKKGTTATTAPITATTVNAACPAAPAATADPAGSVSPPALGTYTYASCTDANDTQESKYAAGQSGGGVTRRQLSSEAAGFQQTATVAYGSNGVLLESIVINSPQGKISCDWKPDVQNYPASLKVGTEWNANSSCDLKQDSGASPGKLSLVANGKVTGKVSVNVAGTTVNAWVIESNIKLTTNVAFGSTTVNVTALSHFDPVRGLDVFRHSQTQSEQGTMTRDEHLVSLTPKS